MSISSGLFRLLEKYASPVQFCRAINLRNFISGRDYSVQPAHRDLRDIYRVTDRGGDSVYVCRKARFRLYRRGVRQRLGQLAADYHLTSVDIKRNGLLIDCGANVGELGLWAKEQGLEYIPFEPEPIEAICCDLNNRDSSTRRYALWKETTTLPFYSMPDSADSSVFFMGGKPQTTTVQAITLDCAMDFTYLAQVHGTVVLKIEAEGAEPEALIGAKDTLTYVDYVTVDCGSERGVEKAHTLVEVANILIDHGFRPLRFHIRRVTSIFGRNSPVGGRQDAIAAQ